MKKWSNSELLDWVKNIGLSEKWQSSMVAAIEENECTGQDFASLESGKQIGESFDIKIPMLYNRIFREINKIKKEQENNSIQAAMQNLGQSNQNNNYNNQGSSSSSKSSLSYGKQIEQKDGEFELNIFGQSKYWTIKEKATKNTTVRRVKELYKDAAAIDTPVDDIVLISKGVTLASDKTLGQIGITNERHRITVKFKVVGGMAYQPDYDSDDEENRNRKVNFYKYSFLRKSKAADCLMGYDNDDIDVEGGRADIGCPRHHAMVAGTMYKWIKTSLEKNLKAVTVSCPIPACKRFVLDWDTITAIATMNGKEYAKWTGVIEDRLKPPSKKCPYCKAEAQRKQGVIIFRMRCTACRKPDWCWNCEQQWKGGGLIWCSNANCGLIQDTNKFLRDAPKITPEYLNNVTIPNTRACPSCLTFIEHKQACKHMTCIGCTTKFCFVCLGIYDKANGKWPCNSHTFECNAAPVQEFK